MKIGPMDNSGLLPGDRRPSVNSTQETSNGDKANGDKLSISEQAQKLRLDTTDGLVVKMSDIDSRLAAVKRRIERGFYEKPQIRVKIIERLSNKEEILHLGSRGPSTDSDINWPEDKTE